MIAFPRPIVSLVTSGDGNLDRTLDVIAAAARAGVGLVQIREPGMDDRALLAFVRRAVDLVGRTATRIIVNERADVAIAGGAAGVHLRESSMPAARVRAIAPGAFAIGRSVHSIEAARAAEADGACDYLVFGTVFRSTSKPEGHTVAGIDRFRDVCAAVRLPVLAIGGIDVGRVPEIAAAGGAGIAAIGLFREAGAIARLVRGIRGGFDTRS